MNAMDQPDVRMMCPNLSCRRFLTVPGDRRGKTVRCGRCGTFLHVPAAPQPPGAPRPGETSRAPGT